MDWDMILSGVWQTVYMTFFGTLFGYLLGFPLGVFLVVTQKKGVRPAPHLNMVVGWIVNIGRSIPFLILIAVLIPVTRQVMGTAIGNTAAIFPLFIGSAPFIARMVETSLEEVPSGLIEAAEVMGANIWQLIWKVYIPEALPSLLRGASISMITVLTYTTMAGAMGAGGLGKIAIIWGYQKFRRDVMLVALIFIIIIVQFIQIFFGTVSRKIDKRR